LFNNRCQTGSAIAEIMSYLGSQYKGFNDLPEIERLKLGMQFYNCERGRLQKGKMLVDILAHLIPLILALGTIILALKK
jgi:hypothetical protein